jgi:hypothetical protein
LDVKHGALQYALKSKCRLGILSVVLVCNQRCGRVYVVDQPCAQAGQISAAVQQHIDRDIVVQQCQQQMLNRHVLVTLATSAGKSAVEGYF